MARNLSKTSKIQKDDKGHFVWDRYFVRGKENRSKRRVTVIDGKIIEDLDAWLLVKADGIFLHQEERWDLIEQRRRNEEESETPF